MTFKELTEDDETLIIVTADHSHAMTINGYPERGNNILGKLQFNLLSVGALGHRIWDRILRKDSVK